MVRLRKSILSFWWLLPICMGLAAFAFAYCADPSEISLWRLRTYAGNCIAMCFLVHGISTLWLFMRRRWRNGFIALAVVPVFLAIALLAAFAIGPDIESVKARVSALVSVPQVEIKCMGGCLRRESEILFHIESSAPLEGEYEELQPKGQIFETVLGFLRRMNVDVDKDARIKVFKFPMEFDTVFCIVCGRERWIIFYGNIVM